MPKSNPDRQVVHERHLARRIREEREVREWSLERLAQRMTASGCPMDRSAIHRIEQGNPPRRITVDEAVTFANVFGMPLSVMLMPAAVAKSKEATRLWRRFHALQQQEKAARTERHAVEQRLRQIADDGYTDEVLSAAAAEGDLLGDIWLGLNREDGGSTETSTEGESDGVHREA